MQHLQKTGGYLCPPRRSDFSTFKCAVCIPNGVTGRADNMFSSHQLAATRGYCHRRGRMVVLVDDEDRENEGDLAMAAEKITPDAINFMAKQGRGLICMPLTEERCDELRLPLMSPINTSVHGTAFTEAVDARVGVTTGISASDRAISILTAIDPKTKPRDLARPGHIFPLRARKGGVLVRAGQTEASVDLARIAGLTPASVI